MITSKPLDYSWTAVIGTFLTASAGAWMFYQAQRLVLRELGWMLPGLGFLIATMVLGPMLLVTGWLIAARLGAPLWNYHLVWPHVITLLLLLPVWAGLLMFARRFLNQDKPIPG